MKRKLSILLILIMFFTVCVNSYTVKADFIFDYFEWSVEALREVGLIYDPSLHPNSLQEVADEINENDPEADVQATNESIGNYITENTTVNNDNSKTYNQKVKNIINYQIESIINESGYVYIYSTTWEQWLNNVEDGTKYNTVRRFLNDNTNVIIKLNTNQVNLYELEVSDNLCFVVQNFYPNFNQAYSCTPYNISSWDVYNWEVFEYSDESYISSNTSGHNICDLRLDNSIPIGGTAGVTSAAISKNVMTFLGFRTVADMKRYSVGMKPYYINSSVYNDWSTSSGDYTVDNSNYNPVTYGDITSYIDSFNTEYGRYPSDTDIHDWIINYDPTLNPTPTPNPNNPSGGGSSAQATANNEGINITINNNHSLNFGGSSVSGNTVSGNGSGSSGGIAGIFDFLSQIGDVLGNLVKNVGHVLAELVTGIGETISSLLEGIPTIFGDFMGALLGWLPDELQALITLSISAMIIVGVIKLFRG